MTASIDTIIPVQWDEVQRKRIAPILMQTMRDFNRETLSLFVRERLSGGQGLNRRTGNLARDFIATTEETPVGIVATMKSHGISDAYAGENEYGGWIHPARSKYLWIPTRENQTAKGVARISPREARNQGGFFAKGLFFGAPQTRAQARGAGPRAVPLFILKKEVYIPARMGATSLWNRRIALLDRLIPLAVGRLF